MCQNRPIHGSEVPDRTRKIKDKIQGRTAILISHRVGFARLADKIIMMDKGKIVEQGTHDELMKKRGAYAQFFYEQAKCYQ